MSEQDGRTGPPPEVLEFYEGYAEEDRLAQGASRLEFERTKEIVSRVLPAQPARVVDVGGAAGAYSLWLAERGHEVHLIDATARLVAEASRRSAASARPLASVSVADARAVPRPDASAELVLLLGPLYHLPSPDDRRAALEEARRLLVPGGVLVAAAISRYASALDGVARKLALDPQFVTIRDRDLADGQHRNETGRPEYFTTAYFHRPEELHAEMASAGFAGVELLGVEGPGWLMPDFESRWEDESQRRDLLNVARALEREPSVMGVSAHIVGVGRKAARAD